MADKISKGDAVVLSEEMRVSVESDAEGNDITRASPSRNKKAKPPYTICGVAAGFYLGTCYTPELAARMGKFFANASGKVQKLEHAFVFNTTIVYIDPKYVTVIAQMKDAIDYGVT